VGFIRSTFSTSTSTVDECVFGSRLPTALVLRETALRKESDIMSLAGCEQYCSSVKPSKRPAMVRAACWRAPQGLPADGPCLCNATAFSNLFLSPQRRLATNCLRDGQMVELPPLEDQDCCVHRAGLRFSIPQISSCIMEPRRKKIKLKINRSSYQDYRHWDFG